MEAVVDAKDCAHKPRLKRTYANEDGSLALLERCSRCKHFISTRVYIDKANPLIYVRAESHVLPLTWPNT